MIDPDILTGYALGTEGLPEMFKLIHAVSSPSSSSAPRPSRALNIVEEPKLNMSNKEVKKLLGWTRAAPSQGELAKLQGIQTYSAAWVASKRRMAATSNEASARCLVQGRLFLDVQRVVQTKEKYRLYTLQEVCEDVLGQHEELLSDDQLGLLLSGRPSAPSPSPSALRGRALLYLLRQAELPLNLLKELHTIEETVELGRVTGINLADVHTRGQMVRTWALLQKESRQRGFLVPGKEASNGGEVTHGPLVLDPTSLGSLGLYGMGKQRSQRGKKGTLVEDAPKATARDESDRGGPVVVLDFASMYPSIMIGHNICYSTLVLPSPAAQARFASAEEQVQFASSICLFSESSCACLALRFYRHGRNCSRASCISFLSFLLHFIFPR